jgi:magnesium chelatase subunit D
VSALADPNFPGDAALATALFSVDPVGLGGVVLRAGPGPHRDRLIAWLRSLLPETAPLLRVPLHVTDDRLLGGLSLSATLRAGRVVAEEGLLAQASGGVVVLAMAERIAASVVAHVSAAIDRGELVLERAGLTGIVPCRIGVVALDEGLDDERAPAALSDRLAFKIDLTAVSPRADMGSPPDHVLARQARGLLPVVELGDEVVEAFCQASVALGVPSLRVPLLAAAAARAHAAWQGRTRVEGADAVVAARLVLGPRATRLDQPAPDEEETLAEPADAHPDREDHVAEPDDSPPKAAPTRSSSPSSLEEIVLKAAKSGVPAGLLDTLVLGPQPRAAAPGAGKAGLARTSSDGGRPAGTRAAVPRSGERLNVVETLRAAAPWQRLRRRVGESGSARRVEVRKEDLRITRFQQRTETCVIFAVDASGSAALQRLAEAKGAVEQVLSDCYVRRDHVALVAFRRDSATLLLPPTRSLARVRRTLADLAGGGTTPLAAGIDAALALALEERRRGRTPLLVLMTDGRGNVARNGSEGGTAPAADALAGARALRAAGVRALFLDTAPRPRAHARALASEMGARYLPLPYLDPVGISRHVQSLAVGAT